MREQIQYVSHHKFDIRKLLLPGQCHKHITIVNFTSSHQNDVTTWSITYDCHSDNSSGVIYAPRVFNYAPREQYSTSITHDDRY